MSEGINKGGLAFPWSRGGYLQTGMTLRDYFAAAALPAILTGLTAANDDELREIARLSNSNVLPEIAARSAYKYADAMLAEREKGTQ